jgi:hypothetical protein
MLKDALGPTPLVVDAQHGGRELATHLTRLHPHAKVLFMSGYPDFALRQSEGLAENAEVLQEPFSLKSLASKARFLLDNHASDQRDTHRQ